MKILFTGGGGAGSEAIYRLLKDKYIVYFSDANIDNIHPSIPNDRKHLIPLAEDSRFVEKVVHLCVKLSIDLIVPTVDEELYMLSELKTFNVMSPDPLYINTMLDKLHSSIALLEAGLDAPETILFEDFKVDNWLYFPCIAKPRSGRGSRNVHILDSMHQVKAYLSLTKLNGREAVLQKKIIGQEYTVLMAADSNKRLHAIVPVKVKCKRGITIDAVTEYNDYIKRSCMSIHRAFPTHGCYNIQLILTEDGKVFTFEINPRISTTFCMGIMAGIDPIEIYINKKQPDSLLPFKTGIKLKRYWKNFLS